MFTQRELEIILSAGVVLICLAISVNVYWILNGWQIEAIRRTVAKVMRPKVESWLRLISKAVTEK